MKDSNPSHGFTKDGREVHAHTASHMSSAISLRQLRTDIKKVESFNAKLAVAITSGVGTMACAYSFAVIALLSLPAILTQAGWVPKGFFPHFLIAPGLILIIAWIAQTFIQLVLLSIIMVGQSVQSTASDARASKMLEDVESILDKLDVETAGGLHDVNDTVIALDTKIRRLERLVRSLKP